MIKKQKHITLWKFKVLRSNPVIWWPLMSFIALTIIIGSTACYHAYRQKRAELLAELDQQLLRITEEYKDITEEFWAIYLPIFEDEKYDFALNSYFSKTKVAPLSPQEQFELKKALSRIASMDEKVQWVVIYSPKRETNYIYFTGNDTLQILPKDFPYLDRLQSKRKRMNIYARECLQINDVVYDNIAIVGGVPGNVSSNSIMAGYNITRLKSLCEIETSFNSLCFHIVLDNEVIFSSHNLSDWPSSENQPKKNSIHTVNSKKWYVQTADEQIRGASIFYTIEMSELFLVACQNTITTLLIVLSMAILAVAVYLFALKNITNEVNIIKTGLDILSQNNLDYRINNSFSQPELGVIADAINHMSLTLKENIDRAHEYERRQIESELQELQAKFNPHFLYNTLEMFRLRCYQNGDKETADLIAQTASIFRGFIGSETFIPLQEELASGKRYLALFQARYGESVKVVYNISTEVLQYGIIRNVFQPLIENYFEHGYDPANTKNYFFINGAIRDEDSILFTIEDNGRGMNEHAIKEFNLKLNQSVTSEKESYGLRNLHQRLQLFYGKNCGITLRSKEGTGLVIDMIILRKRYNS